MESAVATYTGLVIAMATGFGNFVSVVALGVTIGIGMLLLVQYGVAFIEVTLKLVCILLKFIVSTDEESQSAATTTSAKENQ